MNPRRRLARRCCAVAGVAAALMVCACLTPPPPVAAIPATGLAVRLYVVGASAQDARRTFEAARQNNKALSIVNEGGDGEVLVALESDSPKCTAPTGLCSFRVFFRVRGNDLVTRREGETSIMASASACYDLCAKALSMVVVRVLEEAALGLRPRTAEDVDASPVREVTIDASLGSDASRTPGPTAKRKALSTKEAAAKPAPVDRLICGVARGNQLPADEVERRTGQVEVLKRLGILDSVEYDCLRKAYLERL